MTSIKTSKQARLFQRIVKHGEDLLALFPDAQYSDPVKLCKALRAVETRGHRFALRLCNGPEFASEAEEFRTSESIISKARKILGSDRVWLNRDPRGYALKIDLQPGEELHKDWGGYGIIAPDLSQ